MHNLFLGELAHHCRRVWNMNIKDKASRTLQPHSAKRQAAELASVVRGIITKSITTLTRPRKGYLLAVARKNGVDILPDQTKTAWAETLMKWVRAKPDIRIPDVTTSQDGREDPGADEEELPAQEDHSADGFVIGAEIIGVIQGDITRTTLPSWIERPPRNFGHPSHGKLKADHWRTVCTVNMVITLVRLWGSHAETDREKKLLRNFLDLIIAVEHASRRSMNSTRVGIYSMHILRYLQGLKDLFPDHQFVPNHHLSLHLTECLARFGPVHAWWSFPFERYNGVMGRFKKNFKPNQMEITFLKSFCRGSNLRALLTTLKAPPGEGYEGFLGELRKTFLSSSIGTVLSDVLSFSLRSAEYASGESGRTPLDTALYDKLLVRVNLAYTNIPNAFEYVRHDDMYEDKVPLLQERQTLRRIRIGGGIYNSCKTQKALGNSFVIFRTPDNPALRAGQIQEVFLHRRRHETREPPTKNLVLEPFLVVKQYKSLDLFHQFLDPYATILHLNTWLCYNKFEESHVLLTSDIVSHFASYTYTPAAIGQECIVVRSLDRVSLILRI
ncbi:hypothetical protein BDN72DRAFT_773334 [Pluteus cervinus]|uniref:Uncharacterized protein n=1 Tax=Pluteus cervinus TaxID=181527 RepID=A0ACD3AIT6_9AGAR|nr:hypothetical protein BDN72DRAFT_773334 [Pluteus cervinus]